MRDDVEIAALLVREAAALAASMLHNGLTTEHKTSSSDVVSAADHAAEELIVARLREVRPDDGLVGEEGTNEPGERTWFIDPVDGTYNFLSGLPLWCSALALTDADGPVLGAIYHPATDEMWLGGREHPTTCNGVPVAPLNDRPLAQVSLASYLHPATLPDDGARIPLLRVIRDAATVRMLGSGSIELAAVAAGRLGAWVQVDTLDWDWLPGLALVEGAGGATAVFRATGHRWHIAGSRQAVAEIRTLVHGADRSSGGLPVHLEQLVADAAAQSGCTPTVRVDGPSDEVGGAIAVALLDVAREALANIVRHSYASTIEVTVAVSGIEVVLSVRDNGVGPNDEPTAGKGLREMASQAEALGGSCTIEATRPMGTTLRWSVPR